MTLPQLFVGCPMWAHRAWVGRFLPSDTPSGAELAAYSRVVNAVEGNTTFYASPTPEVVARWAAQAEPGFRFVFKVPSEITHQRRLRDVGDPLAVFCRLIEPLGPLVGGLTFQMPASFGPADVGALSLVLANLPHIGAWPWSVELRHPAFFTGAGRSAIDALLQRHGVERVLLDSRPLFAQPPITDQGRDVYGRKPRVPALESALTDQPIVRLIGSDDPAVTATGLARWEPIVATWIAEGRAPTLFVHTPDNAESPALARRFHAAVAARVDGGLAPLPEPLPVKAMEQGSLF